MRSGRAADFGLCVPCACHTPVHTAALVRCSAAAARPQAHRCLPGLGCPKPCTLHAWVCGLLRMSLLERWLLPVARRAQLSCSHRRQPRAVVSPRQLKRHQSPLRDVSGLTLPSRL